MKTASRVDTEINAQLGHSWEKATVTLVTHKGLDIESLSKKDACTVRLIKSEEDCKEYEFTMTPTPTYPAGTEASIQIDSEGYAIIKVVACDFISRRALMGFLHYVLNVDLEELYITRICFEGAMGSVLHPEDEVMFAGLFGS